MRKLTSPEKRPDHSIQTLTLELEDIQALVRPYVPFAAKPAFHCEPQVVEGYTVAGLKQTVGTRQCVVKDRVVGEIAHGEIVDPAQWARMASPRRVNFPNRKPAHEHAFTLNALSKEEEGGASMVHTRFDRRIKADNYGFFCMAGFAAFGA
jgi:hypothetical protein